MTGGAPRPELQLVATWQRRPGARLGPSVDGLWEEPRVGDLVAAAQHHGRRRSWTISGAEPTLRADLPDLLEALTGAGAPGLTLTTDGLALATEDTVLRLVAAGLRRVRVWFHCGHADANDWLVGLEGAARRAYRALRCCRAAGLELEAAAVVSRPTAPYLAVTVGVLARIGVSRVVLHRMQATDLAGGGFVGLSPRFAWVESALERAVDVGRRRGVEVRLLGFPPCACGRVRRHRLTGEDVLIVAPTGDDAGDTVRLQPPVTACTYRTGCRWSTSCDGAPSDYVATFGWQELLPEARPVFEPIGATADRSEYAQPPPRGGRGPATRRTFVVRQADREQLRGDPLGDLEPRPPEQPMTIVVRGPGRVRCSWCAAPGVRRNGASRALRQALLRAAQEENPSLRLVGAGAAAQPWALQVVADALRLPFSRVELATDISPLDEIDDDALAALDGLARLDGAVFGPDAASHDALLGREGAFDATMRVLARVAGRGVTTGLYGVLHDGDSLRSWHEVWARGGVAGEPLFRLCRGGGSLDELASRAGRLDDGPVWRAVARTIPPCLLARPQEVTPARPAAAPWNPGAEAGDDIVGADPLGSYEVCPEAAGCRAVGSCPGLASGWSAHRLRPFPSASGAVS